MSLCEKVISVFFVFAMSELRAGVGWFKDKRLPSELKRRRLKVGSREGEMG